MFLGKHWDYIIPKIAGKFYAFCIIAQTFVHSCRKTQWQLSGTHFIGRYLVFSNVNVFFPDPNEIERKSMKSKFFSTKTSTLETMLKVVEKAVGNS